MEECRLRPFEERKPKKSKSPPVKKPLKVEKQKSSDLPGTTRSERKSDERSNRRSHRLQGKECKEERVKQIIHN